MNTNAAGNDVKSIPDETALFVGAFFDELCTWGVQWVIISPGSRSTPLAMVAYEMNRRYPGRLHLMVDIDERGAAFLALGRAKASGRPVALICTSGTAPAHYYPAVIEAATSRVPLIVLTGDRPERLQALGAPQTSDQIKLFGDYVKAFRQMPAPAADEKNLAFARQAAREACLAALGGRSLDDLFLNSRLLSVDDAIPNDGDLGDGQAITVSNTFLRAAGTDDLPESDIVKKASGTGNTGESARATQMVSPVVASRGCAWDAGPVHLNFPFDEPLKPNLQIPGLFGNRSYEPEVTSTDKSLQDSGNTPSSEDQSVPDGFELSKEGSEGVKEARSLITSPSSSAIAFPILGVKSRCDDAALGHAQDLLQTHTTLVLAGEGTCETLDEAREVAQWAHNYRLPLLADPLSGLRSLANASIVESYDSVFSHGDYPEPTFVIRFGRYPVSKQATLAMQRIQPLNLVVDAVQTRDFNAATDLFLPCSPLDFVRSFPQSETFTSDQNNFFGDWLSANDDARARIDTVKDELTGIEGAYVRKLLELVPEKSCIFSASSMAIRALDQFYLRNDKPLAILCNRAQNGIDGTVSSAIGASFEFPQTTLLIGDFALLHDLNAMALQRELLNLGETAPSIVMVLMNNNGGAIFDMLPQQSDDPYFERLFLAPQDVAFAPAAAAFNVPYQKVFTVGEFEAAYREFLGRPGLSLVEIELPLRGVKERYARYR